MVDRRPTCLTHFVDSDYAEDRTVTVSLCKDSVRSVSTGAQDIKSIATFYVYSSCFPRYCPSWYESGFTDISTHQCYALLHSTAVLVGSISQNYIWDSDVSVGTNIALNEKLDCVSVMCAGFRR